MEDLAEYAAVVTPIKVVLAAEGVTVDNRRHDSDTGDLTFRWVHEVDGRAVASGSWPYRRWRPAGPRSVPLPTLDRGAAGEHWLTVTAAPGRRRRGPRPGTWSPPHSCRSGIEPGRVRRAGGRPGARHPQRRRGVRPRRGPVRPLGTPGVVGPLPALGGEVTLWRAPHRERLPRDARVVRAGRPGRDHGARRRRAVVGRTVAGGRARPAAAAARGVVPGPDGLTTRYLLAAANSAQHLTVEQRWRWSAGALQLDVDVQPSAGWTVTWPRVGVHLRLPAGTPRRRGSAPGPGENYADSRVAARVGRFSAAVDDLTVRYAVPQESGHREALRELRLRRGAALRSA